MRLSGLFEELSLVSSVQRHVALAFFTSIGARLAFVTDLASGSQDSPGVGALAGIGLALRELARKTCRESKVCVVSALSHCDLLLFQAMILELTFPASVAGLTDELPVDWTRQSASFDDGAVASGQGRIGGQGEVDVVASEAELLGVFATAGVELVIQTRCSSACCPCRYCVIRQYSPHGQRPWFPRKAKRLRPTCCSRRRS